jgi:putative integral membrane protein (TIGR02587 family)
MSAAAGPAPIRESLQEYGRGMAGGLMFSLPMLYTVEVWEAGIIAPPVLLIGLLVVTYVLLLGYNRFAGIHDDSSWMEVAIDSVEELGLGIVLAAAVLYLLGRIGPHSSLDEAAGKIVIEASLVAIGFSIGTAHLHASNEEEPRAEREPMGMAGDLTIAFCGAILFAANVGPTEEIVTIAVETHPWRLVGLAMGTVAASALILYFTNFKRSAPAHGRNRAGVVTGTTTTYAIALLASALILWFFGRFEGTSPDIIVAETVVLAFPSTLGASAGRLLLQSS